MATQEIKQHIAYQTARDGTEMAVLTLMLPNGQQLVYRAKVDPNESKRVAGAIIGAELAYHPEVGFNFGKMLKGVTKGIGKLAKGIATSKVFKLAAAGLAIAAPLLGPIAPVALAASAGMGIASKLSSAGVAAARGAKNVARAFTSSAALDARRLTSTPEAAAALLAAANTKRLRAETIQDKGTGRGPTPARVSASSTRALAAPGCSTCTTSSTSASARAAPSTRSTDILAHARAGHVRSSDGSVVTTEQLLGAHRQGRIFWISL